jgi:rhodanese-related sulfurtransferase
MRHSNTTVQVAWRVIVTLLVMPADPTGAADPSDAIPSVRFRYEGTATLTGSPIFDGAKTDYYWGELSRHNSSAGLLHNDFNPSDPEDSSIYTAVMREEFALDANTIIGCIKSIEIDVDQVPQSLEDAKAMHANYFRDESQLEIQRYFETAPSAHERLLKGYSFLGMTPDGPIVNLADPTQDSPADRPVFVYKSANGIEYRLEFDRARSIFRRCRISLKERSGNADPFLYESEVRDSADGFVLTSLSTQNPSSAAPVVVRVEQSIFDFVLNRTEPLVMAFTPKIGERIDSLASPQIKYKWQDGQIVKDLNPYDADNLAMQSSRRWMIALNFLLLIALAIAMLWHWRKRRLAMLVLLLVFYLSTRSASASNAYCGVYALYGAASALGVDVDLEELIDAQYISSMRGSSAQDLVLAAESLGLHATPLWGLGVESLRVAETPLILHAAPMGTHAQYQHWILFLGFDESGQARVVDGAGGVALCTIEDVLARWDGIALAVRSPNARPTRYLSAEIGALCFLVVYGGIFSLAVSSGALARIVPTLSGRSQMWMHVIALLLVSVCIAYASEGAGFRNVAKGIDSALGLSAVPKIDIQVLLNKMRHGALLIDCRYQGDYELGSIEGAISLPVDSGLGDFQRTLANIDRYADVVVYCQSAKCSFSDYSATMLAGAGFKHISVFEGGYEAWENYLDRK